MHAHRAHSREPSSRLPRTLRLRPGPGAVARMKAAPVRRWCAALAGITMLALPPRLVGETWLVKDGRAQAEIVVAPKPARMARLAATELQEYLYKITGAKLAITSEPAAGAGAKIFVGRSPHTEARKLDVAGLAHGAFRIAAGPDWFALLGPDRDFSPIEPWAHDRGDLKRVLREWDAISGGTFASPYYNLYAWQCPALDVWLLDDAGTLNAVHEFLRGLGVRWYFPGELGEVVPRRNSVALPAQDRTVRPDFPLRSVIWWSMQRGLPVDDVRWTLRLGVNYGPELLGLTQNCHGMKFVTTRQETKDAHPEYYALWDGKRAVDHRECGAPCLSSEGLYRQHMQYARTLFDHYREPLLSLDVCDGYGYGICGCELCRGKATPERDWNGSMSDYVWGYIDRAARDLLRTHPDRKVSGLAYSAYLQPPAKIETLSPNLSLLFCQARNTFSDIARRDLYRSLRAAWLQRLPSKELYVFDYYLQNRPGSPTEGIPAYFMNLIADDLRSLRGLSRGDTLDTYRPSDPAERPWHAQAVMHLNLYVTSRLWWDATLDVDQLLDEYFTRFYGPAAAAMKAFVRHAEAHWPQMAARSDLIDESLALLARAEQAARDGVFRQRVNLVSAYVQPLHLLRQQLAKKRENVPDARALKRATAKLKLDGRLDDAFWSGLPQHALRPAVAGQPPPAKTQFAVACGEDDVLYLAVRCDEPVNVENPQDRRAVPPAEDVIELLIETPVHSFYRIALSAGGTVVETDCAPTGAAPRWSSGATVAVHRSEGFWSAEVRLPPAGENTREIHSEHGIAGRRPSPTYPWFLNVGRRDVRNGRASLSAWSPTGSDRLDDVLKFGRVWVR